MIPPLWTPVSRKAAAVLRLTAMALVTIVIGWAGWLVIDNYVPPQDLPWKPLSLEEPVGRATSAKLVRLAEEPQACFALLDAAGVETTRIPGLSKTPQCFVPAALTLDQSLTPYSATLSMTCPLAAALHMWERQVVIPEAERILGAKVVEIETFGSWSCRRVNHAKEGRWSQHAVGAAVDISGFKLDDGRRITVKKHFKAGGEEGEFLHAIRDKGCRIFRTTLSPDYNRQHADHFHFDMGDWKACR